MNKSVNPLVAVAVILTVAVVFGLKYWFDGQALEVARPSLMQPHPDGGVAILVGTSLYHLSPKSRLVDRVDLDAFGVTKMIGDFAYFSNGDLLVRAGPADSNLAENLRTFARAENTDYRAAPAGSELSRCSVRNSTCSRFSSQLPVLDRTFRLHIDWSDDSVYLADTSRGRIMVFAASGELLGAEDGFKFPNQLRRYDGKLWVADTNHNGIRELIADKGSLITPGEIHPTIEQEDWRWPNAFARVGDRWWVNTMLSGMRDGKILIYDQNWNRAKLADLPENADPVAMEMLGGEILVSDLDNIAVYRFTQDGVRLPDLDVRELTTVLAVSREKAQRYQGLGYLTLSLGILAWMAVFAVAMIRQNKHALAKEQAGNKDGIDVEGSSSTAGIPRDGFVFTVSEEMRRMSRLIWSVGAFFLSTASWIFLQEDRATTSLAVALLLLMLAVLPVMIVLTRWPKVRITMYPDRLVVHDHRGQKHERLYRSLPWSNSAVLVKGQVIPILESRGRERFPGFASAIRPFLNERNRMGWMAMTGYAWRSPEGALKSTVVMTAVLAVLYVFLKFDALNEWLLHLLGR